MCKCTPEMKTPFCGKPGCEWPEQKVKASRYDDILARLRASTISQSDTDKEILRLFGYTWRGMAYWKGDHPAGEMWKWGWPTKFTSSIDDALALVEKMLPGSAWSAAKLWDNHTCFTIYASKDARHLHYEGESSLAPIAILIALFEALKAQEAA